MRVNHNSLALNASDHFATINKNIAKSMSRLSSGYKITSPSDDAAGLAISTKMDSQIRGLGRAALNSNDGVSVIQASEGGMEEIHSILGRMRELAVQASNDVLSEDDRDAIQEEINSLAEELTQIADTTAFNGQKLLNGDMTRRSLSVDPGLKASYIAENVSVGKYELEVTAEAEKAEYPIGLTYSNATVTKEQAGTLTVNTFQVRIEEGMSMTEVFGELQTHLNKIGIEVMAMNGDDPADFDAGYPVVFRTKEYGSAQKIEISCGNPELAALLGVTDGDKAEGKDVEATLNPTTEGFTASATYSADGNTIHVVDRNGFEMDLEVDPEVMKAQGNIDTVLEVFSAGTMVIQSGSNSGEQISIDIPKMDAKGLGVDNLSLYTHRHANEAIEAIDEAVKRVSQIRSKLGAYENRLTDVYDNLTIQQESLTAAYSRIMDTDMAAELTEYTQLNVLSQAAISMIQKSNERPESILQLLQ